MSFIRAPFRLLIFVYTIVVVFLFYRAYISKPPRREIGPEHRAAFPHAGSWATWFIPGKNPKVERQNNPMQGWNILHHLGGNGPWIEHVKGEPSSLATPEECSVDQIHLLSRHGERYPTTSAGNRHLQFLKRVGDMGLPFNGSLSFLNEWSYFSNNTAADFGQLTNTGPYAGTLGAFTTGVRFRTRYGHLIRDNTKTRLWASGSSRVIDTARHFASGFFGLSSESQEKVQLQVIPEQFERGADTLTPGDTCLKYLEDTTRGHDNGLEMLARFQNTYLPPIAERLIQEGNSGLKGLSSAEVYSMQEMCGFEIMVRGSSPWCDVFTEEDWYNFEYARDLLLYYRAGPGNPYAGAMGWLWLNATAGLLREGPIAGGLFLSFVHDGDIASFLTALGIFTSGKALPTTHLVADRAWRISAILPMGARITLERLSCSGFEEPFVRININDRIIPLPFCNSGPGDSCPVDQFVEYVRQRKEEVGDFATKCGLRGDTGHITFLHQN